MLALADSQAPGLGTAMGSCSGEYQSPHASSLLLLQPMMKSRNIEMWLERRKLAGAEPQETFIPAPL